MTMFMIDLFSGAGGLAEGFINEGFIPIAHVEMDKDAVSTICTRLAFHYLESVGNTTKYSEYLNKQIKREELYALVPSSIMDTVIHEVLSENTIDSVCKKIEANMDVLRCTNIDALIGGPPCQTYSIISRNTKNINNKNDQRNHLYKLYTVILGRFKPKFFIFENVPGLKYINGGAIYAKLIRLIKKQGYTVVAKELNAAEYGVLQKRTRLIITGWLKEYTLTDIEYQQIFYPGAIVNDILKDLAILYPGQENNVYIKDPSSYLINSGIRPSDDYPLTQHICRNHNENDREIYRIAARLWNEKGKRLIYSDLPSSLITRTNPNIFKDKYKVVAGDVPSSHTVIAHIAKDGHYYIHPYINQGRSISVREAARIQSFADNFYFEGSRRKILTQIGNAVPPMMSRQLASTLKEALNNVQ